MTKKPRKYKNHRQYNVDNYDKQKRTKKFDPTSCTKAYDKSMQMVAGLVKRAHAALSAVLVQISSDARIVRHNWGCYRR